MQTIRATRRMSVARLLGVGRIGSLLGERGHESIRARGEKSLGRILYGARAVAGWSARDLERKHPPHQTSHAR